MDSVDNRPNTTIGVAYFSTPILAYFSAPIDTTAEQLELTRAELALAEAQISSLRQDFQNERNMRQAAEQLSAQYSTRLTQLEGLLKGARSRARRKLKATPSG